MRDLVKDGNQSRLVVQMDDRKIIDLPLTAIVAMGTVGLIVSPLAVVAAAVAATVAGVDAHVERWGPDGRPLSRQ